MIQANELRINNYVEYNGITTKVYSINSPAPMKDERYSNKYIIDLFDGAGIITATIDELTPITPTENWIYRLGFEKDEFRLTARYKCSFGNVSLYKMPGIGFFANGLVEDIQIKSIHHLQNICHSLAGKELEQ